MIGMRGKYQTGINKAVYKAIREARKLKFDAITKKDIIRSVTQQGLSLKNPSAQIGQALNQLQKTTRYKRPLIKKVKDSQGHRKGWTLVDETYLWKDDLQKY
jgi:hypothetical protein